MKNLLPLFILLFISLHVFSQGDERAVDQPFGGLKIDQPLSKIKKTLNRCKASDLWYGADDPEGLHSSHHLLDLKKAKVKDYFGLPVIRVEVIMNNTIEIDTVTWEDIHVGEDISRFVVYMEQPSAQEHKAFIDRVVDGYGPIFTSSIHEDGKQSPNWFSSITLLTISGDGVFYEHEGKKYIRAEYRQGYGG